MAELKISVQDGVGTIVFSNPAKMNAISVSAQGRSHAKNVMNW